MGPLNACTHNLHLFDIIYKWIEIYATTFSGPNFSILFNKIKITNLLKVLLAPFSRMQSNSR